MLPLLLLLRPVRHLLQAVLLQVRLRAQQRQVHRQLPLLVQLRQRQVLPLHLRLAQRVLLRQAHQSPVVRLHRLRQTRHIRRIRYQKWKLDQLSQYWK